VIRNETLGPGSKERGDQELVVPDGHRIATEVKRISSIHAAQR
jgi:hypothetical protein